MHRTTIPSWSALLRERALCRRRFLRAAAGTVVVLVGAGLLLPIRADDAGHIRQTSPILTFPGVPPVLPGFATLTRTAGGLSLQVHTSDLPPGVYTFWMNVKNPDGFATGGRVAGRVVEEGGVANAKAEVDVGEIVGDAHPPGVIPAPLTHPLDSRVALTIRYHGPASEDPAQLFLQLHTFQEGMATNVRTSIFSPP